MSDTTLVLPPTFVLRQPGSDTWHYPDGNSNVTLCGEHLGGHLRHEDWRPLLAGETVAGLCAECARRLAERER